MRKEEYILQEELDLPTLSLYCEYVLSENSNIRTSSLSTMKKLFDRIDSSIYKGDPDKAKRLEFIKRGLEARVTNKLKDIKGVTDVVVSLENKNAFLSSKKENWKTNLFKTAYIDKMKKLNGNGYKSFLWYDVFFTLDKYWVLEDELPHMSQVAKKINSDTFWKRAFKNIFLLTPSCIWMINPESGKFEKIRIPPQ